MMKLEIRRGKEHGFVSYVSVVFIGVFLIGIVLNTYRASINTREAAKRTQVRVNYKQQEEIFLNDLLNNVPLAAIQNMMSGSNATGQGQSWARLINNAVATSNNITQDASALDGGAIATDLGGVSGVASIADIIEANNVGDALSSAQVVNNFPDGGSGRVFSDNRNRPLIITTAYNTTRTVPLPRMTFAGTARTLQNGAYRANPNGANNYPIITSNKRYRTSTSINRIASNPDAPADNDILLERWQRDGKFALIRHPNTNFRYRADGKLIARHNWWAFSATFGGNVRDVAPVTKNYLFSIYEIPLQTPVSSLNRLVEGAKVSDFDVASSSSWGSANQLNIDGSVVADEIVLDSGIAGFSAAAARNQINATGGGLSGVSSSALISNVSSGSLIDDDNGNPIVINQAREEFIRDSVLGSFLPSSAGSQQSRSLFLPIRSRREQYLRNQNPTNLRNSSGGTVANLPLIRPIPGGGANNARARSCTDWERYSSIARSCGIQIVITNISALGVPTNASVYAYNPTDTANGSVITLANNQPLGSGSPNSFTAALTGSNQNITTLYRDDLDSDATRSVNMTIPVLDFDLVSFAAAINAEPLLTAGIANGSLTMNSISVDVANTVTYSINDNVNGTSTTVNLSAQLESENPLLNVALILKGDGTTDLSNLADFNGATAFANGLSIVHNGIVYFPQNFNITTTSPPTGSVANAATFFPPVSIFARDKRYGDINSVVIPQVVSTGRMGNIRTSGRLGNSRTADPLEVRFGRSINDQGDSSLTQYNLSQMQSAAEVPPVNMMHWLVTIEEIN